MSEPAWIDQAIRLIKGSTKQGVCLTVRELACRFKVRQKDILDELECHDDMTMNVGLGSGKGYHRYPYSGDYSFEWVGEPPATDTEGA